MVLSTANLGFSDIFKRVACWGNMWYWWLRLTSGIRVEYDRKKKHITDFTEAFSFCTVQHISIIISWGMRHFGLNDMTPVFPLCILSISVILHCHCLYIQGWFTVKWILCRTAKSFWPHKSVLYVLYPLCSMFYSAAALSVRTLMKDRFLISVRPLSWLNKVIQTVGQIYFNV